MASGVKVSQLTQDTDLTGGEKILITDTDNASKFATVESLQNKIIEKIKTEGITGGSTNPDDIWGDYADE